MELETPHILGSESTNEETGNIKSNLVDPFPSAFKLKEPTLVVDETSDIARNCSNYLLSKHIYWVFSCFCILLILSINISFCLEKLEGFTFQTEEPKNKVIEDSENSLSTNENTKTSLTDRNPGVSKENIPNTDEEVVDGSTKDGESTPQKDESFDDTLSDNVRMEEKIGEWW